MAIEWPSLLPDWVTADGFREVLGDAAVYTKVDSGPVRARRNSTAIEDVISCSFILTRDQYRELRTFYKNTLYGGSRTFSTRHPVTSEAITVRMRTPPEFVPLGGGFMFQANCVFHVQP